VVVAQPPPIRKRRPVWIISAAVVAVVYVVVVGLVSAAQPDLGRSTAVELAADLQAALDQRDADRFESLFARGAVPHGYAEELFAQLPPGAQVEARPVMVGDREAVTVSMVSGPERWCTSWLVEPAGDRLVLSVTPAVAAC
jgi:hypothetical protein